jgi:hypothetical protein
MKTALTYFLSFSLCVVTTDSIFANECEAQLDSSIGWSRLTREQKISYLEDAQPRQGLVVFEDIDERVDPGLRAAVEEMSRHVLAQVSRDAIEDSLLELKSIFAIGDPYPGFVQIYEERGQPIALAITVVQNGGATKDRRTSPPKKHYPTKASALAAGLDADADVSWQVSSYFEWNGREWHTLKLDIFDEGGFSWSGW